MIACRSLISIQVWERKGPLHILQKYKGFRGLSRESKMDDRKGKRIANDGKNQNTVKHWRNLPGLPSHSQGVQISTISTDEKLNSSNKHSMRMEIGSSLMRFVKGKWGGTQEEIEKETGVKIIFPPSRQEDFIVIEGNSTESIDRASEKIQIIIDKAVNGRGLDYSHFVSLPLAIHPGLVEKLITFQDRILGVADNSFTSDHPEVSKAPALGARSPIELGIERSIFINPKTFHLTVLMLKLWNKDRVKTAADVLQDVSSKVMDALDNQPLLIRLKGLDCMKGSMSKARVLYAPVEEIGGEGRLLRACQIITDAFVEAGLVIEKDVNHTLKLHATLMNARHRKRNERTRNLDSFDATGIFQLYGSEEWGVYPIHGAHLSQRFVYDDKGYYYSCASIPFPVIKVE